MSHLPAETPPVVRLPDGTWAYADQLPAAPIAQQPAPAPQVVHVHQAAPDRTVQRLAVGAGMGGGALAAAVYLGPMLTAALASIAMTLAVTAVVVATGAWALHTVVRSLGSTDAERAVKTITTARKTRRRG